MTPARVIAHRGGASHAPENTLAAFARAGKSGVSWIECDVALLGDGTPIIFHDATFDRTTNGSGTLARHDMAYVQKLDAGSWFSPEFKDEPIPTLSCALETFERIGLHANLELKVHGDEGDRLADAVAAHLRERPGLADRLIVSSFDHTALGGFRRRDETTAVALLYGQVTPDWPNTAAALGATGIFASHRRTKRDIVEAVRSAGLFFGVFTINDPAIAAPLWGWGVTSVFTDDPSLFEPAWLTEIRG